MTTETRLLVYVEGRVQGVGYRYWTQAAARALGLRGWVRNLSDGRVEALLVGDAQQVQRMLAAMRRGPEYARVQRVTSRPVGQLDAGPGFRIRA